MGGCASSPRCGGKAPGLGDMAPGAATKLPAPASLAARLPALGPDVPAAAKVKGGSGDGAAAPPREAEPKGPTTQRSLWARNASRSRISGEPAIPQGREARAAAAPGMAGSNRTVPHDGPAAADATFTPGPGASTSPGRQIPPPEAAAESFDFGRSRGVSASFEGGSASLQRQVLLRGVEYEVVLSEREADSLSRQASPAQRTAPARRRSADDPLLRSLARTRGLTASPGRALPMPSRSPPAAAAAAGPVARAPGEEGGPSQAGLGGSKPHPCGNGSVGTNLPGNGAEEAAQSGVAPGGSGDCVQTAHDKAPKEKRLQKALSTGWWEALTLDRGGEEGTAGQSPKCKSGTLLPCEGEEGAGKGGGRCKQVAPRRRYSLSMLSRSSLARVGGAVVSSTAMATAHGDAAPLPLTASTLAGLEAVGSESGPSPLTRVASWLGPLPLSGGVASRADVLEGAGGHGTGNDDDEDGSHLELLSEPAAWEEARSALDAHDAASPLLSHRASFERPWRDAGDVVPSGTATPHRGAPPAHEPLQLGLRGDGSDGGPSQYQLSPSADVFDAAEEHSPFAAPPSLPRPPGKSVEQTFEEFAAWGALEAKVAASNSEEDEEEGAQPGASGSSPHTSGTVPCGSS